MSVITADTRGLVAPCPACGQKNRVPFGREAKCGKCGTALPPAAETIEIPNAAVFDALITQAREPVLVDFWAPWCGPCLRVAPEFTRLAAAHAGQWLIAKVNTEALPELGERFGVQSIPTMALFAGGREIGRAIGARPASEIERFVRETLAR